MHSICGIYTLHMLIKPKNPWITETNRWLGNRILSTVLNKCSLEEPPSARSSSSLTILHPSEILGEVIGSKPGLICILCSLCSPRTGRSNRQEMKRPRSADQRHCICSQPWPKPPRQCCENCLPSSPPHLSKTVMAKANYHCGGFSYLPQEEKRLSGPVISSTKRIYRS